MKIKNGTPEAMALLDAFKKEGNLVDIYSSEFFSRQPTYDEDPEAPFFKDGMDYIDELESEPDEDKKPKNHLLFIFLDDSKQYLIEKLLNVYPTLRPYFTNVHHPDFLILNLYTKQMLCVGFGRKNQLFIIDADSGNSIRYFNLHDEGSRKYLGRFSEHDAYDAIDDFLRALLELSQAMFDWDHLPFNDELIEIAIDEGPKSDGLYYIDDDDQGYSLEELNDYLEQYEDANNREKEAMKVIRIFFPQQDWWELNTGDY